MRVPVSGEKMRISLQLWELIRSYLWSEMDELTEQVDLEDHASIHPGRAPRRYFNTEMRRQNATIAITILSVAFLESYVNELIDIEPSLPSAKRKKLQGLRLRDKYCDLYRHLTGDVMSISEEPFKDFNVLVGVRNALVHHTPGRRILTGQLKKRVDSFLEASSNVGDLANSEYVNWVATTADALVRRINSVITQPEICLNPDEEDLFWVAKRWKEAENL